MQPSATLRLMKLLTATAIATAIIGVITALTAWLTWPTWDAATEYTKALTAADYAGTEAPTAAAFLVTPAGFYTGHTIALAVGITLIAIAIGTALLALHARALGQTIDAATTRLERATQATTQAEPVTPESAQSARVVEVTS